MPEEIKECPLCGFEKIQFRKDISIGVYHIDCKRCGNYSLTEECLVYQDTKDKLGDIGYVLSALVREVFILGDIKRILFNPTNVNNFLESYLIPNLDSVEEKARKLLQRLREMSIYYAQLLEINYSTDYPLAYAKNEDEFMGLMDFLDDSGLIKSSKTTIASNVKLTAQGWDLTNKLKKDKRKFEQVFIAAWFDEATEESIKAIEETVIESGYKPMCIKEEHFSDRIMDKALSEIRNSKFIVVDLTGSRPSVFFEIGFGFGLDIDILYVYKDEETIGGSQLEFYVKHYQCYSYKTIEELKEKLLNAIGARIK